MREFSWKYFSATGAIDAYLLYKEYEKLDQFAKEEIAGSKEEVAATEE